MKEQRLRLMRNISLFDLRQTKNRGEAEIMQRGASWLLLLTKYYSDHEIRQNGTGEACDACG